MDIIIKKDAGHFDPRHPESTDPTYKAAYEAGQKRIRQGQLKFENEAQERDYWKAIKSNPSNVPGLPEVFPPIQIRSALTEAYNMKECQCEVPEQIGDGLNCLICLKPIVSRRDFKKHFIAKIERMQRNIVPLYCEKCAEWSIYSVRPHIIDGEGSTCTGCGSKKPYRLVCQKIFAENV